MACALRRYGILIVCNECHKTSYFFDSVSRYSVWRRSIRQNRLKT
ncbi:MAG: hypothetical protein P8X89_14470 [Reinekea sp.]